MIVNSTISYKSPQGYRPDLRSLNNAAPLALRLLKRYSTEKHGHQQSPPWPIDTAESPEVVKTPPATRDPGEHRGIPQLKSYRFLVTCTDLRGGWGGTEREAHALNNLLTGGPEAVRLAEDEGIFRRLTWQGVKARTVLPTGVAEVVSRALIRPSYLPKFGEKLLKKLRESM